MLILDRAFLREIATRLLLVTAGVTFLIGLGGAIRASSISQGAPLWVPLTLVPLIVGQALPYFVPVALLTAVVLAYGRMAADGEDVAALAAGAAPLRLLLPAALAGLAVGLAMHPLNAETLPNLYRQMREVAARVQVAALENTDPGASELHFGGLNLMWRGRDPDGAFREVLLHLRAGASASGPRPGARAPASAAASSRQEAPLEELRVRADRARMRVQGGVLVFSFEGLRAFSETGGAEGWNVQNDGLSYVTIDLATLAEGQRPQSRPKDLPSSVLKEMLKDPGLSPETRSRTIFTLHQRRAMSASALPLALLGAVLGWRLRKGGVLAGFGASIVLLVLLFYPAYYLGEGLFAGGAMPPTPAAWLPFLVLLPPLLWASRGLGRRR